MNRLGLFCTALIGLLSVLSRSALATDNFWNPPTDANWNLNTRWTLQVVPTPMQNAIIASPFSCTVTTSAGCANLDVIAGQQLIVTTGANLMVTNSENVSGDSAHFGVGYLNQNGGVNTCTSLNIGQENYGQYGIIGGHVVCTTLDIDATNGYFNLDGGALYIHYPTGADPITAVKALLATSYAQDFAPVAGFIFSTYAQGDDTYAIGFADSADPGNPAGLPANTIKIMCTLNGDVNLDGLVNATDFAIFGTYFGTVTDNWDQGDFNYDGFNNASDFALLGQNFGKASVLGGE